MKSIYISLPISGHEDTYERRLNAAVRYVKAKFPEYDRIITPKEVAENLEKEYHPLEPKYKEYLPCWSVGRLIEIYLICALECHPYDDFYTETPSLHLIAFDKDRLIDEIIEIMFDDTMDFAKLED